MTNLKITMINNMIVMNQIFVVAKFVSVSNSKVDRLKKKIQKLKTQNAEILNLIREFAQVLNIYSRM